MASGPPDPDESRTARPASSRDRYFDTAALRGNLRRRSLSGGATTLAGQATKFGLQLLSLSILARILTPEDFGLVVMVTAITSFVVLFKDMGLSMATVQRSEISHAQVSTLFWINFGVSAVITGVVAALAPAISWFYGEPRLTPVALVLACAVLISGLSIQHRALLKRQMHFGLLTTIDILAYLASVLAAVGAALAGAGYWALVVRQIVQVAAEAVGSWIACGWRPGLPVRRAGARKMVGFGLDITLYNIINYFARNADKVLLGRFYDSTILGFYGNAYQLMMMPVLQIRGPVMSVATPGLSSMQNDPDRFRRYYLQAILLLAFVTMPLMTFLFVCAEDVIGLVLGKQWFGAVPIFRILAVTAFIQPVETTRGFVMIALGQTRRYLLWGCVTSTAMVLSFAVGLPWGAVGVATAYTAANYLMLFPSLWFCLAETPVSVGAFVSTIARPVVASLVMGAALHVVRNSVLDLGGMAVLPVCGILAAGVYLGVWLMLPGGARTLREFREYANHLLNR